MINNFSPRHGKVCIKDLFISTADCEESDSNDNIITKYIHIMYIHIMYDISNQIFDDLQVDITDVTLSENDTLGLVYIGGYLVHSILKNNSCTGCTDFFTPTNIESTVVPQKDNYYSMLLIEVL